MLTKKKSLRIVSMLLICVMLCGSIGAFADGTGGDYGIVKGSNVNLRTKPDASDPNNVLGLLQNNERINITSYTTGSGYNWVYGTMADGGNKGKSGYVVTTYLTLYQQR